MTFDDVINTLSKENLTAKFTQNFYTYKRNNRTPYGYYEIDQSSLGPLMIEVGRVDDQEENPADIIEIKGPGLDKDSLYVFDFEKPLLKRLYSGPETTFDRGIRFVKSLQVTSSRITEKEAFLRSFHFNDSEEEKKALYKHYLNARVMYDTMDEMIGAKKCTFYKKNGGYVIRALFGDGSMERIDIKPTKKCYEGSNVPYTVMNIIIPSIELCDKFDGHTNSAEVMVFRKAEQFINMLNNPRPGQPITEPETFTRWDTPYINLMAEIKKRRGKAK